jgi:UDP-sulfoquinovose synthase
MGVTSKKDLEALIGQSSLGTLGAQMLRDRADPAVAERIRDLIGRVRVLVLGGDGYCGWPTALYLSDHGYHVTILDNLSRRNVDNELGTASLTPIRPIEERLRAWKQVTGHQIGFINLDLATEYDRLVSVLLDIQPDAIVHFASQRAAAYSMSSEQTKRYTVDNNVRATHNLLAALTATGTGTALVHLGSMGVYGYDWPAPIPEGYLTVKVPTPDGDLDREILHPASPGSVYHMTKTLDELMLAFYARNDGLRITDLHQGIVWGTQTDQTSRDKRLINRFDYDGDYGTVLNRFLMQAAIGHPLTVYGSGEQTRAFIHIRDTVRCIEMAITNPPQPRDKVRVLNQMTETHRVRDLAKMVADITGVDIAYLPNPRREAEGNDLAVRNDQFLALGLQPTTLSENLLDEIVGIAKHYRGRADVTKIISRSVWRRGMETPEDLLTEPSLASARTSAGGTLLKKGTRVTGIDRTKLAADLKKQYESGASIRALATATGRSYGFVFRILTENGVYLRSRGGATRGKARANTERRNNPTGSAWSSDPSVPPANAATRET